MPLSSGDDEGAPFREYWGAGTDSGGGRPAIIPVWGNLYFLTTGGYPHGHVTGYPASLGKVNLVQRYQGAKNEVICARGKLSAWGVAGKMTLLRLYWKGIAVV